MDLSHVKNEKKRYPATSHIGLVPHTNLLASVWYARVSLPMRSIECSRCLREVLYTYILGFLTNNGMPPTNIFDILVRSVLTQGLGSNVRTVLKQFG